MSRLLFLASLLAIACGSVAGTPRAGDGAAVDHAGKAPSERAGGVDVTEEVVEGAPDVSVGDDASVEAVGGEVVVDAPSEGGAPVADAETGGDDVGAPLGAHCNDSAECASGVCQKSGCAMGMMGGSFAGVCCDRACPFAGGSSGCQTCDGTASTSGCYPTACPRGTCCACK